MSQADLAIRISNALNVSVDYLVIGTEKKDISNQNETFTENVRLYRKYAKLITVLESFPPEKQKLLEKSIEALLEASK